jgi:hypothetical protein
MDDPARMESVIISAALGGLPDPPVNLHKVARYLGVADIRPTNFRDGFTNFNLAAPVIYINSECRPTRWRFLLAHELAHVMLRMRSVLNLIEARGQDAILGAEEELADRIATTMLIPDRSIERLGRTAVSLRGLTDFALFAGVPVTTLVASMALRQIDIALLHWRRSGYAWHVIDRPGSPPCLHGYVTPSDRGNSAIGSMHSEEAQIVVECTVNGRHTTINGRGYRQGRQALQLIRPSIDIRMATSRSHIADANLRPSA